MFLFSVLFLACSIGQGNEAAASATLRLDPAAAKKILSQNSALTKSAVSKSEQAYDEGGEGSNGFYIELSLNGGFSAKKTAAISLGGAEISFERIPVGAVVWASATVYRLEGSERLDLYQGASQALAVKSGANQISLALKKIQGAGDDIPVGPENPEEPDPDPEPVDTSIHIFVSASADPDAADADGTEEKPYATIAAAIATMDDAEQDYTIEVSGTLTDAVTIPTTLSSDASDSAATAFAKSLAIVGAAGDGSDGIKLAQSDTTIYALTVSSTSVPVTVKNFSLECYDGHDLAVSGNATLTNVKLTQTYSDTVNGSHGVSVSNSGSLTLDGTTEITGLKFTTGDGAVYVASGAKLFMNGSSKISACKAPNGGGLCVEGEAEMNGNASIESCVRSVSSGNGGGVIAKGKFTMNDSSSVKGCETTTGGGVYVSGGTFTMNDDASVSSNTASGGTGGGVYIYGGSFVMNGGSVTGNTAGSGTLTSDAKGGGVYVATGKTFAMNGGTISENLCTASAQFMSSTGHQGRGIYNAGTFSMGGSALVADGNDIFLDTGSDGNKTKIAISSALSQKHAAKIVTSEFSDGSMTATTLSSPLIEVASGSGTTLAAVYNKFTVPQDDQNGTDVFCKLGSDGTVKEIGDAGDILFTDGTAVGYSATLALTDEQKAKAMAVIFYSGTDCSNQLTGNNASLPLATRTLGVGLQQTTGLAWCTSGANAYNTNITTIQCYYSNSSWSGDLDGSDNFSQIGAFLTDNSSTDDTSTAANYPAFNWANTYSSTATNLADTDYASGWYIPTARELYCVYSNVATVNAALALCGGTEFLRTSTTACRYWSSSQSENESYATSVKSINTYNGTIEDVGKNFTEGSSPSRYCAIRAF